MARDTGHKLKANELQIENNELTQKVFALQSRLEIVADLLAKYDIIQNTPHAKYRFVNGLPDSIFPTVMAEYQDVDGMPSK